MTGPRKIVDRICASCAVNHGSDEPRPRESMIKMVAGEMLYSCSPACSVALGWVAA